MYHIIKELHVNGLRYPRIVADRLIGSREYSRIGDVCKYAICVHDIDSDFNVGPGVFIDLESVVEGCLERNDISYWMRDCYRIPESESFECLIEFKYNMNDREYNHRFFILRTENFTDYEIVREVSHSQDCFVFKILDSNVFASKISVDEDNPDYFWGKYLFEFEIDGETVHPTFDEIVDYEKDKGHVIHSVRRTESGEWEMLFSIRHWTGEHHEFIYKIYTALSLNLIDFHDTKEVEIDNMSDYTEWVSYPSYCEDLIVCNQDEFGKYKGVIIMKKI